MLRIGKVIAVTETRCQSAYCLSIALSFSQAALISGPAEATWPARMSLIWLPTGWRADAARCVTPTNFVTWPPVLGFWLILFCVPQLLLYIKRRHNTTQRFPVKKHTCARTKISSRPIVLVSTLISLAAERPAFAVSFFSWFWGQLAGVSCVFRHQMKEADSAIKWHWLVECDLCSLTFVRWPL